MAEVDGMKLTQGAIYLIHKWPKFQEMQKIKITDKARLVIYMKYPPDDYEGEFDPLRQLINIALYGQTPPGTEAEVTNHKVFQNWLHQLALKGEGDNTDQYEHAKGAMPTFKFLSFEATETPPEEIDNIERPSSSSSSGSG
jgi:hypothetical protein